MSAKETNDMIQDGVKKCISAAQKMRKNVKIEKKRLAESLKTKKCSSCREYERACKKFSKSFKRLEENFNSMSTKCLTMTDQLLAQIHSLNKSLQIASKGNNQLYIYAKENIDKRITGPFHIVPRKKNDR